MVSVCLFAIIILTAVPTATQATTGISADEAVQRAWRLALETGIYHFSTNVEQTIYPTPAVANVGRSSRTETFYLEGDVNTPMESLYLTLFQNSGNVVNRKDGVEIRIEGNQTYGRPIDGEWQEMPPYH